MKTLLQLGMHFDAAGGGADRYFAGLLGGMKEIGAPFEAMAFGLAPKSPSAEEICFSLGPRNLSLLKRLAAIRRVEVRPPDALVTSHFALYGLPLIFGRHFRHIAHFHGPWALESAREGENKLVVMAKKMIENYVYSSSKRLITLSTAFHDILVNDYAIPEERIRIVPGGVDEKHFQPSGTRMAARKALGWPTEGKVIFCVRRLVPRMGLRTLVDAFAKVAALHDNVTLIMGGRGPLTDELNQQIIRLGLQERIRLVGFVSEPNLPLAYTAANFSIVPSQALEGFGLVTIESLACGTPVLVTPVGGLPEAVASLDKGLVLEGTDLDSLVRGMRRGLAEILPEGAECRDHVLQNFTWANIARKVLAVYQEAA